MRGAALLGRIGTPSVGVILTKVRLRDAGRGLKQELSRFNALSWSPVAQTTKG
jgi:hypothetical protein